MLTQEFLNYGTTGVALGAIVMIVRYFLTFQKSQQKDFVKVITNHLHASQQTEKKLAISNQKLTDAIVGLQGSIKDLKK